MGTTCTFFNNLFGGHSSRGRIGSSGTDAGTSNSAHAKAHKKEQTQLRGGASAKRYHHLSALPTMETT